MEKKNFLNAMLAICCGLVMSAGFVACDSDDDEESPTEETEEQKSYFDRTLASAEVEYYVSLGKDELQMYDVQVQYMDATGTELPLTMTDTVWTWKRTLKPDDLPAKFVLRAKPSQKEGLNLPPNAEYEVGCITKLRVTVKNQYGRIICERDDIGLSTTGFVTMTGEQIMNPWSSAISDLFGSLFNTDKKSLTVYSNKIVYNGMSEHYW